jgi:hypothetical protein
MTTTLGFSLLVFLFLFKAVDIYCKECMQIVDPDYKGSHIKKSNALPCLQEILCQKKRTNWTQQEAHNTNSRGCH